MAASEAIIRTVKDPGSVLKKAREQFDLMFKYTATMISQERPEVVAKTLEFLQSFDKVLKDQIKTAKEILLAAAEQGEEVKRQDGLVGYSFIKVPMRRGETLIVKRQLAWSTGPDAGLLGDLLYRKKLSPTDGMNEQISYVPDTSKLERLILSGKLTREEVLATHKQASASLKLERE